ncbi:hypothetical protein [Candidatus Trichorickettsia mobilis]|nr:hypothetical protein [Candidatus Trichorickettsia mobilis]
MNVEKKLHLPHIIKGGVEVNFLEILNKSSYTSENIISNPFINELISTQHIINDAETALFGNEIISAFPNIPAPSFGEILGACIFDHFHQEV